MFCHISASSATTAAFFCNLRSSLFTSSTKLFRPNFHFYPSFPLKSRQRHSNFSLRALSMDSPPVTATVDSVADDLKNQTLHSSDTADEKNDIDSSSTTAKLKLEELNWDHSFVRELPGDPRTDIISREVLHACYSKVQPSVQVENPQLVAWSESVAELLDLDPKE